MGAEPPRCCCWCLPHRAGRGQRPPRLPGCPRRVALSPLRRRRVVRAKCLRDPGETWRPGAGGARGRAPERVVRLAKPAARRSEERSDDGADKKSRAAVGAAFRANRNKARAPCLAGANSDRKAGAESAGQTLSAMRVVLGLGLGLRLLLVSRPAAMGSRARIADRADS